MSPRRKRYLDNTTPADNTANVVRPVNRMIQVKQQDTPARREKETREYQAKVERGQRIMSKFNKTPAGRRAANRNYTIQAEKAKQEAAKEEAAAVAGTLFKPLMPSTYVDMIAAAKNGQVNNAWDVLAAPYLNDSWSARNPGKALVLDIALPVGAGASSKIISRLGEASTNVGFVPESVAKVMSIDSPQWYKNIRYPRVRNINEQNLDKMANSGKLSKAYRNAVKRGDADEIERIENLWASHQNPEYQQVEGYHTVHNRYDPNFNVFDTEIEGHPTSIYTAKDKDVSKTYFQEFSDFDKQKAEDLLFRAHNGTHPRLQLQVLANKQREQSIKAMIARYEQDVKWATDEYNAAMKRWNDNPNSLLKPIPLEERFDYKMANSNLIKYKRDLEELPAKLYEETKRVKKEVIQNAERAVEASKIQYTPNRTKHLKGFLRKPFVVEPTSNRTWNSFKYEDLKLGPNGLKDYGLVDSHGNPKLEYITTRDIERYQRAHGYDGAIINNVYDLGPGFKGDLSNPPITTVYEFNNPGQVKLKGPTYDDSGNLIDIVKRFDLSNPDMRYSWLLPFIIGGGVAAKNN